MMPIGTTIPEFDEVRFPEKITFGFTGGPEFFTQISSTTGGYEQRNANWEQARHRYQATHEFYEQSELDELLAFFQARRGKLVGFRFWDVQDFASDMVGQQSNTDGSIDTLVASGLVTPQLLRRVGDGAVGIGDGAETEYQLIKTYLSEPRTGVLVHGASMTVSFSIGGNISRNSGNWATDGFGDGDTITVVGSASNDGDYVIVSQTATSLTVTPAPVADETGVSGVSILGNAGGGADFVREITKPVRKSGTIQVRPFVDSTEYSEGGGGTGFSIDDTTGIITFNVAPPIGDVVEGDFLFDVPVRFNTDLFSSSLEHHQIGEQANIELLEIRQ
jgi:hypothetical protein